MKAFCYRIGRRGATLLFLGGLDVLFGYSLLAAPVAFAHAVNFLLPYAAWGWIWISVGIVCLLSSPLRSDRIAFAFAAALKMAWGLVNGYVWLNESIPRLWVSAAIWLGFAALVTVISSWPESLETHRARALKDGRN